LADFDIEQKIVNVLLMSLAVVQPWREPAKELNGRWWGKIESVRPCL